MSDDPFPQPSARSNVAPFMAMDVMSAAAALERAGRSIMRMEVGEPAAPPPRIVREAAIAALGGNAIGYTEALGRPSLRQRIARHYGETYGADVAPSRIVITTGSSGGFVLAFLALFSPGDRVAVAAPGYPAYRNIMEALGIICVPLDVSAATRFCVDAATIEAAHRDQTLAGVLLMSPANPSGTMMTPDALAAICATCDALKIAFISDEIYHGLTYGAAAASAAQFNSRATIVNSFSKYYCMTGWRVGWLVLPETLVRPVERLQQSFAISVPTISQIAAEVAFDARDELEAVKEIYRSNRALLMKALPRMGITHFHPPDGAFYIYADVGHLTNDSMAFCKAMLNEAGVAVTPGLDFDRTHGARTLRISYAGAQDNVVEAVKRLEGWLSTR